MALSRELSKLHEETLRGTVEELLEHLQAIRLAESTWWCWGRQIKRRPAARRSPVSPHDGQSSGASEGFRAPTPRCAPCPFWQPQPTLLQPRHRPDFTIQTHLSAKHVLLSKGRSKLELKMAATTDKSLAGSWIFNPPAKFKKTSY